MPSKILFNDLILLRQRAGIACYVEQILAHLSSDLPVVPLSSLALALPIKKIISSSSQALPHKPISRINSSLRYLGHDALEFYIANAMRFSKSWDIYHEPDTIPLKLSGSTLTTVHDVSVTLHPEWHPPYRVLKFKRYLSKAIERSKVFIAVSQTTKTDMVKYWKIDPDKIEVIYEAARPQFRPMAKNSARSLLKSMQLPARYFLVLGTIEPRKNIEGVIHAYSKLPASIRNSVALVIAGGWGWKTEAVKKALSSADQNVHYVGYVRSDYTPALVACAEALVYPSYYEGFGLPPLEAMTCETPVISSSTGSLEEVLANAALFVNPYEPKSITEALERVACDPTLRQTLIQRGRERVTHFSWDKAGKETSDLYRRFLNLASS